MALERLLTNDFSFHVSVPQLLRKYRYVWSVVKPYNLGNSGESIVFCEGEE